MESSSLIRWLLIGAALFLFFQFGYPLIAGDAGGKGSSLQPLAGIIDSTAAEERAVETFCDLQGDRFKAQLTSRGGVLKHAWLQGARYKGDDGKPLDMVTTSLDSAMPLRTAFREPSGTANQVPYDDLDWKLEVQTGKSCTFVYSDDNVELRKVVSAGEQAYELKLDVRITNKSDEAKKHRLTVKQTDWRTNESTQGSWGRLSQWLTKAEAYADGEPHRFEPTDFDASEFEDEGFTAEKWRAAPGPSLWAAVSSSFFTKAVFHVEAPAPPTGEMLIEQLWDHTQYRNKDKDPNYSFIYHARLNYGIQELAPQASATYQLLAYVGPKERAALAAAGGGTLEASELLDLGIFGWIGKLLIGYLYWLFGFTKTWGLAICLLTITVKVLMFPLSISQIKSSMAMRKLKPEMDDLNKKYKDDATQRGLAMQELWRKNNVTNPMLGCLPVMFQMPVWFALYTSLQTAVELYHTPFAWFPDLSAPDGLYILPILLGASSFLQQMLMPMQGDQMQMKMMRYMMPAMFTVFMLFLPAGLGIYFLTNTWLGIVQQLVVERFYNSQDPRVDAKDDGEDEEKKTNRSKRAKAGT
jgi:YidC/Oxa1 family membrane protein insertase